MTDRRLLVSSANVAPVDLAVLADLRANDPQSGAAADSKLSQRYDLRVPDLIPQHVLDTIPGHSGRGEASAAPPPGPNVDSDG